MSLTINVLHSGTREICLSVGVVLPRSGSEPWFEPEPNRTHGPVQGLAKTQNQTSLEVRGSAGSERVRMGSDLKSFCATSVGAKLLPLPHWL